MRLEYRRRLLAINRHQRKLGADRENRRPGTEKVTSSYSFETGAHCRWKRGEFFTVFI